MRTKRYLRINIVLILTLLMGACNFSLGTNNSTNAGSVQARIIGWDLNKADPQVVEVINGNLNNLAWRQEFEAYLAAGYKVEVFIDCDDGRIDAGSQFYARIVADGGQLPFHFTIGSLAGEVTPEMISMLNIWIDNGWVRSINVSSHTCEGGTCGAQGVKAELERGKVVSDYEAKGLGKAATWIKDNLDSSDPKLQVEAQVEKIWQGTGGRVPVFGWVADHATQIRTIADARYTLNGVGEDAILQELVKLNAESATVLGPQAKAQNLAKTQSFSNIVVTDSVLPVEMLVGLKPGGLDEAFNASFIVPGFATEAEILEALGPVEAAILYSLAHATPNTQLLFMFKDMDLMARVWNAVEGMKVYQDFKLNPAYQESVFYQLDAQGTITRSLLVKPAFTAVSSSMTIGPNFRGQEITQVYELNGVKWAVFNGSTTEPTNMVLVRPVQGGVQFAKIFKKFADAKFFLTANQAGEESLKAGWTVESWNGSGGIVYMTDMGEELFQYLARTGNWSQLPDFMKKFEAYLVNKASNGYAQTDFGNSRNFLVLADGNVTETDFTPTMTFSGPVLLARFPSLASYQRYAQRGISDMVARYAGSSERLGWGYPVRANMLTEWPALTESVFSFAGANVVANLNDQVAFEQALSDLGSTNPEIVARGRNTLNRLGATQIDNQWVLFGENSAIATGPVRFQSLVTRYPDGAKVFVGWQTNKGVFGFERAENVSGGIGNWRIYAPSMQQFNEKLSKAAPAIGKGLTVLWTAFVAKDLVEFSEQTDYMMVTNSQIQLYPPTTSSYSFWSPNEKTPYVVTRWEVSLADLQTGCNGTGAASRCGGFLPESKVVPIALIGSLAGEYIPQQTWPSFGLDGNNADFTWKYMHDAEGIHLWNYDTIVNPGETIDYYVPVINEYGIWMVPYHAEFMTGSCQGLCVQQSHGGEEFADGDPVSVDLCPTGANDACYWRP